MRKLGVTRVAELARALRAQKTREAQTRLLHRLHCVSMVANGFSCYEVARCFGDSPRTVERWVERWNSGGVPALGDHEHGGPPSRLDDGLLARLRRDLREPPTHIGYRGCRWTGSLLVKHLNDEYAVVLGLRQAQRVLSLLHGRPRGRAHPGAPVPANAGNPSGGRGEALASRPARR